MEVKLLERVRLFIVFHSKRHPRELGEREVTALVSHLAERGVSASTQNQALSAVRFLSDGVLGQRLGWLNDIVLRDGKGGKHRVTMLPAALKGPFRAHRPAHRALSPRAGL